MMERITEKPDPIQALSEVRNLLEQEKPCAALARIYSFFTDESVNETEEKIRQIYERNHTPFGRP